MDTWWYLKLVLVKNKIEQLFKDFNPILDQGCLHWLITFVQEWTHRNQNIFE